MNRLNVDVPDDLACIGHEGILTFEIKNGIGFRFSYNRLNGLFSYFRFFQAIDQAVVLR